MVLEKVLSELGVEDLLGKQATRYLKLQGPPTCSLFTHHNFLELMRLFTLLLLRLFTRV